MAREKIFKLLELTTSDNDAEALNAIRKANEVREKADLQWHQIFAQPLKSNNNIPPMVHRRPPPPRILTVEIMFDEILKRNLSDPLRAQIEQLKYVYEWTESLSGDEVNTLVNTYNRNCF